MVCGTEPSKGCRLHDVAFLVFKEASIYALELILDTSQVALSRELLGC